MASVTSGWRSVNTMLQCLPLSSPPTIWVALPAGAATAAAAPAPIRAPAPGLAPLPAAAAVMVSAALPITAAHVVVWLVVKPPHFREKKQLRLLVWCWPSQRHVSATEHALRQCMRGLWPSPLQYLTATSKDCSSVDCDQLHTCMLCSCRCIECAVHCLANLHSDFVMLCWVSFLHPALYRQDFACQVLSQPACKRLTQRQVSQWCLLTCTRAACPCDLQRS
jgi:hypothetical protein